MRLPKDDIVRHYLMVTRSNNSITPEQIRKFHSMKKLVLVSTLAFMILFVIMLTSERCWPWSFVVFVVTFTVAIIAWLVSITAKDYQTIDETYCHLRKTQREFGRYFIEASILCDGVSAARVYCIETLTEELVSVHAIKSDVGMSAWSKANDEATNMYNLASSFCGLPSYFELSNMASERISRRRRPSFQ